MAAGMITAGLLSVVQVKVEPPILLLERFVPGAGWAEIALLAVYAGWITMKMSDPARSARWRRWIWTLFTFVFFCQLIVGLLGLERFLMSGQLHLPIPALVVAGPVYRGSGVFMLAIFGATLLLVGRAWCSHLCYIGAWDDNASRFVEKPKTLPRWRRASRPALLFAVVSAALLFNLTGVRPLPAALAAGGFGLVGVALMLLVSRRTGQMVHCTAFCPLGALTSWLGLLSPFRIRISEGCTECGRCRRVCRYDALNIQDLRRKKPAISCTLCGDCVTTCKESLLSYRFLTLSPERARSLFIVLAVSLHAVFLGVARM
jgi:polyferredoxin